MRRPGLAASVAAVIGSLAAGCAGANVQLTVTGAPERPPQSFPSTPEMIPASIAPTVTTTTTIPGAAVRRAVGLPPTLDSRPPPWHGGSGLVRTPAAGPYFPASAWTTPVAANAPSGPDSRAIVAALVRTLPVADMFAYGVPIYTATAGTPRVTVTCTEPWGTCGFAGREVPIPAGAVPSSGSDAAMVVIDPTSGVSYEFWQARQVSALAWQASWGGVVSLHGPGTPGQAVGAGVSRLAGVVTTEDLASGAINHALVFSTSDACSTFVSPASKSDGTLSGGSCIPEGGRVQLNPSIDVAALRGLSPVERMVARALQVYGAYAVDVGGAPMAIVFQDPAGQANPYPSVGLETDYQSFPGIPWASLRVVSPSAG